MKDVLEPFSDIGAPATACWCDCFEGSSRSCDEHKAALVAEVRRLREDLAYAVADAKRWHDGWQERGRIYEADTTALHAEAARVREALQAVRELHHPDCDNWCQSDCDDYPCATVRALDAALANEIENPTEETNHA